MNRIQIQDVSNNSMQELKQKAHELDAVNGGCCTDVTAFGYDTGFDICWLD